MAFIFYLHGWQKVKTYLKLEPIRVRSLQPHIPCTMAGKRVARLLSCFGLTMTDVLLKMYL